ncbi:MAG: FliI/YscN family ATPase [Pseudomonadota bacterium]
MNAHPVFLKLEEAAQPSRSGVVVRMFPGHIEASGPMCAVGDLCSIETSEQEPVIAEVAKVDEERIILVPFRQGAQIVPEARVVSLGAKAKVGVGDEYSGRIIDALGHPLDQYEKIALTERRDLNSKVLKPLERESPQTVLQTGIRAIDGALTLARGQRVGIFAASGVGKTTLIRQLIDQVDTDHCVLCLVGERGREVQSIWDSISNSGQTKRYTCVAATSDEPAALRVRAVKQALCLAEYWRDQGKHVLLLMDSVTRFAMALREVGLAAGEPPTLRAYTPNVFAELPRLVERCGAAVNGGAITAIMTVLSETDDVDDPIVEVMKSLLDGHIVLSRQLAEHGHFPAIDLIASVSRQAETLMSDQHLAAAKALISTLSTYEEAKVMIESGIYKAGSNHAIDRAISLKEAISKLLCQGQSEAISFQETVEDLTGCFSNGGDI